jgi:flagellar L-ring protein precursor FlgH
MRRQTLCFFFSLGYFFLSACAGNLGNLDKKETVSAPLQERTLMGAQLEVHDPRSNTSLFQVRGHRDHFKDLRAYEVGDLVTVNIVETSKATKRANTRTARQSSIDAGISNLMGWEGKIGELCPSGFDNETMFKANMKNAFDGSGETSRDESMTASITARVMQVMPNGNLFIEGRREIKVNNESQFIVLTGLIRPVDISPDNTVLSSYVADASIHYTGRGPVSDKQRPGWLMRAVDFVWPF